MAKTKTVKVDRERLAQLERIEYEAQQKPKMADCATPRCPNSPSEALGARIGSLKNQINDTVEQQTLLQNRLVECMNALGQLKLQHAEALREFDRVSTP